MNQSTNISHEPGATFETLLRMLLQLNVVRDLSLLGELQSKSENQFSQNVETVFMTSRNGKGFTFHLVGWPMISHNLFASPAKVDQYRLKSCQHHRDRPIKSYGPNKLPVSI